MPAPIINPQEAAVLLKINDGSTVVDLSGGTRLPPTVVEETLRGLEARGLVNHPTDRTWSLTLRGVLTRNLLAQGSSSNTYVILDDRSSPISEDESKLEDALDRVLGRRTV